MKTKAERKLEGGRKLLRGLRGGLVATLLVACGGSLGGAQTSGESHFLRRCDDSCLGGLSCIANVCTRSCLVGKSSCGDLASAATCTDQSIEPGAVAVCDQACTQTSDCAALGRSFACDDGFCRGPKDSGGGGRGGAGPGSSGGSGGGAGAGSSGAGTGILVMECPEGVTSDPITIFRTRFRGDVLDVEAGHGGGCAPHEYSLCYEPGFLETYPVRTGLRLIHKAHNDACDAYLTKVLQFDLTPLAGAYTASYGQTSGIISTNFGIYSFGTPSCEARSQAAASQVELAVAWAQAALPTQPDPICQMESECKWVSNGTSCSIGCGAFVGDSRASTLAEGLAAIESAVCRDYAEKCPPLPDIACQPRPPLTCKAGNCTDAP